MRVAIQLKNHSWKSYEVSDCLVLRVIQKHLCRIALSFVCRRVLSSSTNTEHLGKTNHATLQFLLFFSDFFFILIQFGIDKQRLPPKSPWSMTIVKMILTESFSSLHWKPLHSSQSLMLKPNYKTLHEFRKEANAPNLYRYKIFYIRSYGRYCYNFSIGNLCQKGTSFCSKLFCLVGNITLHCTLDSR